MKRIAILLAALGLSAFAGGAPASAQYSALEWIHRYYSGQQLVAEVKKWCDGHIEHTGGAIEGWHDIEEIYYGC